VSIQLKRLITIISSLSILVAVSVNAEDKAIEGRIYGTVVESMVAGPYTYVKVEDGKKSYWAAAPKTEVANGSLVAFDTKMEMKEFTSKTLNRQFDVVYFTDRLITDKKSEKTDKADPHANNKHMPLPTAQPVTDISKAKDGKTIAEILAQKQDLKTQVIKVRGKVMRYSSQVMNKNWIHIKDSSTDHALTITTTDTAEKGDVILATGKIVLDMDIGHGYQYDVVMEEAKVVVEPGKMKQEKGKK